MSQEPVNAHDGSGAFSSIFPEVVDQGPGSILTVSGLGVAFGGVNALSDVTFHIDPSEVVAVVGPNGAGKSTLLNAISGLMRDNVKSGDFRLQDKSLLRETPLAIARCGVARSFQNPPLIDAESVLENVLVGQHMRLQYGMAAQIWRRRRVRQLEAEARERALMLLDFVGLAGTGDDVVRGLSYGARKLIDILRAIISGPKLLLLDEPTSGLDAVEQAAAARVIASLHRASSVSILIVEHHMEVVRGVADRVVVLEAGKIASVGTPGEVLDVD